MAYGIRLKDESTGDFSGVIRQNPFPALVDGSSVTWDCGSDRFPSAKLTSTQSFTINMTNVLSGSSGVLKLITNTASAITITFDTDFTNKTIGATGEEAMLTYTFPAATGKEYILSFVVEGTTIHWVIGDVAGAASTEQFAHVGRVATQSISNNTQTALSFDTENYDNAAIYTSGTPTRITVPGAGNKLAAISAYASFATGSTGIRRIMIFKNGGSTSTLGGVITQPANSATSAELAFTFQLPCVGGDYFEVIVQHTQGTALNVTGAAAVTIKSV